MSEFVLPSHEVVISSSENRALDDGLQEFIAEFRQKFEDIEIEDGSRASAVIPVVAEVTGFAQGNLWNLYSFIINAENPLIALQEKREGRFRYAFGREQVEAFAILGHLGSLNKKYRDSYRGITQEAIEKLGEEHPLSSQMRVPEPVKIGRKRKSEQD